MSVTATLREAQIVNLAGLPVAVGKIYGDVRGRFDDGYEVTTTYIRSIDPHAQTVRTQNSTYKLEPWPDLIRCPFCDGVWAADDSPPLQAPETR